MIDANAKARMLVGRWVPSDDSPSVDMNIGFVAHRFVVSASESSSHNRVAVSGTKWNGKFLTVEMGGLDDNWRTRLQISPVSRAKLAGVLTYWETWTKLLEQYNRPSGVRILSKRPNVKMLTQASSVRALEYFPGCWQSTDEDAATRFTVERFASGLRVEVHDGKDGEFFKVSKAVWNGTFLAFEYFVPSTRWRILNRFSIVSRSELLQEYSHRYYWIKDGD